MRVGKAPESQGPNHQVEKAQRELERRETPGRKQKSTVLSGGTGNILRGNALTLLFSVRTKTH